MISIIMPNFNKARYIGRSIESVLRQTYSDWELIIVDDGSADNSLEIAQEYAARDHRIHVTLRESNPQGGSACRNLGLQQARGEFIIFFDSDDLLLPHALENRVALMKENPDLAYAVFPVEKFYEHPGDCSLPWKLPENRYLEGFLSYDIPWQTMQPVWRRSFVEGLGGFDARFSRLQDLEFHARALLNQDANFLVCHQAAIDCCYRVQEGRQSMNQQQLLSSLVENCALYLQSISTEIANSAAPEEWNKKRLNGTVFAITRKILYSEANNEIDRPTADELLRRLLDAEPVAASLPGWLPRLYITLDRVSLRRMIGIHFFFKRAFIYLARVS